MEINGTSPAQAFNAWLLGGASADGAKRRDMGAYPSNPSCVGMGGSEPSTFLL